MNFQIPSFAKRRSISVGALAAAVVVLGGDVLAESAVSFDAIQFWAGEGPDRAALVIDWSEESPASEVLIWGFRFEEPTTGVDMLEAVVTADDRLFAKVGALGDFGTALYGLGYDWNNDGALPLSDGTVFDDGGIRSTGPADGAVAADAADVYAEGWLFAGFWNYATAPESPYATDADWTTAQEGASTRTLVDGSWDAWTFAPSYSAALPDAPHSAPADSAPGDFDRDGQVDGADLLLQQRTFGMAAAAFGAGADGDSNGTIGPGDLAIWGQNFAAATGGSLEATGSRAVPEPATWLLCATAFVVVAGRWRLGRRFSNAT